MLPFSCLHSSTPDFRVPCQCCNGAPCCASCAIACCTFAARTFRRPATPSPHETPIHAAQKYTATAAVKAASAHTLRRGCTIRRL
eukprot:4813508-Pleurochrysis_carterae.AAC.1